MGDMNVGLKVKDSTMGNSQMSTDMIDFEDCVNAMEVEDLKSSGMHFTWTQKMLQPNAGLLKNLIG